MFSKNYILVVFIASILLVLSVANKTLATDVMTTSNEDYIEVLANDTIKKYSKQDFLDKFGKDEMSKEIIEMYFARRKAARLSSLISLPLGTGVFLGAEQLALLIGSAAVSQTLFLVLAVPAIGLAIFFTVKGVKEWLTYTKKHLRNDLILYKDFGKYSNRIQKYIDTETEQQQK